ncbi:MAG TPA: ribonuclease J [Myxococcaceae bacterium]|nr:ribonuclease J [Myxococcaceae bacterium]
MLRIIPLGGLGEIGLNSMVLECQDQLLLVDAGLLFPPPELPGVELIIPDFGYLRDAAAQLGAVLLTHAHEDHVGALPFLLRERSVPVYGTRLTLALVAERLEQMDVHADLREIFPGEPFHPTPAFEVEAFRVAHSIPDAVGLLLRTPEGTVVHTGDFKLDETPLDGHPTDLPRLQALPDDEVLCLLSDSTNAEVEGETPPERLVAETLERLIPQAGGRVLVGLFASHLHRVQHVIRVCHRTGRRLVLAGRSLERNVDAARRAGHLAVPEGLLCSPEEAEGLLPHHVCILATGAQGEPRAALSQLLQPEVEGLRVERGDTVLLSSRPIPGNERAVSVLINALLDAGARVLHAGIEPGLHVSGHAARAQQRRLLEAVRPRHFVPIHGELRQLTAHLELARSAGLGAEQCFLARDGDVLGFAAGRGAFWGKAHVGRVFESRAGGGDIAAEALAARNRLARSGVVAVVVTVSRDTSAYLGTPQLVGRGLTRDEERVLESAALDLVPMLEELSPAVRGDDAFLREALVRVTRRVFRERVARRPFVVPLIVRI